MNEQEPTVGSYRAVEKFRHCGDGAYVSHGDYKGEVVITANHHYTGRGPEEPEETVFFSPEAVQSLVEWLKQEGFIS